ncbi:hypothetical protein LSAT2_004227 [Lamellibrachia satsuma]|nr:hypothetical protein LSAT2_004227 [Lamellibrachia satsuma]
MNPTRCDVSGRAQLIRRASSALVFPSYGQLVNDGHDKDRSAPPCFRNKPSDRRTNVVNGSSPKTGAGKRLARMNTVADFFRWRRPTSSGVERTYKAGPSLGSGGDDTDTHTSCPSLLAGAAAKPRGEVVKPRVGVTRSCDGGDGRPTRSRRGDGVNSGLVASTLAVPNIFITSLSRSVDLLTSRCDGGTTSERRSTVATRRSAPELAKPATDVLECFFATAPPSSPPPLSPVLVHDNLYIASTDCAYNEPLLCELNIASVVELDVGAVPSMPRSYRPCLCERRERHRPAVLRLGFSQPPDGAALRSCFDQVNRFIDGARRAATNVLVCGSDHQLHYIAVIQYLTARCQMLPSRAYSVVMRQRPGSHLSPFYQRLLADVSDRPRDKDVVRPAGGALLPKDAWSDF